MPLPQAFSLCLFLSLAGVFRSMREYQSLEVLTSGAIEVPKDAVEAPSADVVKRKLKVFHVFKKPRPGGFWHLLLGDKRALEAAMRGEQLLVGESSFKVDWNLNVAGDNGIALPPFDERAIPPSKRAASGVTSMRDDGSAVSAEDIVAFMLKSNTSPLNERGDVVLLVNCKACHNRSPTAVLMYLVMGEKLTLRQAYQQLFRSGHLTFDPVPPLLVYLQEQEAIAHPGMKERSVNLAEDVFAMRQEDFEALCESNGVMPRVIPKFPVEEGEDEFSDVECEWDDDEDEDADEAERAEKQALKAAFVASLSKEQLARRMVREERKKDEARMLQETLANKKMVYERWIRERKKLAA